MTDEQLSSDLQFAGGVAIVAGGEGPLGSRICLALAEAGSHVMLTYRDDRNAAETVLRKIEAMGRRADMVQVRMENAEELNATAKAAIDRYGSIHSVVYASRPEKRMAYIGDIRAEEWARVIEADVMGCFNLVQATLPYLRQARDGSYVAITSTAVGRMAARDILSAAPKAAIEMFMRGLAKEEGRNGIRANCVSPGIIEADAPTMSDENDSYKTKAIPLKRKGKTEEVADATLFLLSKKAGFITGHTLAVDGGAQT